MNSEEIKITRERMRRAFDEAPGCKDYSPLLVLWRFPHLEHPDVSWTFLSKAGSNLLRICLWYRFDDWHSDRARLQIEDHEIPEELALAALDAFTTIRIVGVERGIYDGPEYGRILFEAGRGGSVRDRLTWFVPETFCALGHTIPDPLKSAMRWDDFTASDKAG